MQRIYYLTEEPTEKLVSELKAAFPDLRFGVGPTERSTASAEEREAVETWLKDAPEGR